MTLDTKTSRTSALFRPLIKLTSASVATGMLLLGCAADEPKGPRLKTFACLLEGDHGDLGTISNSYFYEIGNELAPPYSLGAASWENIQPDYEDKTLGFNIVDFTGQGTTAHTPGTYTAGAATAGQENMYEIFLTHWKGDEFDAHLTRSGTATVEKQGTKTIVSFTDVALSSQDSDACQSQVGSVRFESDVIVPFCLMPESGGDLGQITDLHWGNGAERNDGTISLALNLPLDYYPRSNLPSIPSNDFDNAYIELRMNDGKGPFADGIKPGTYPLTFTENPFDPNSCSACVTAWITIPGFELSRGSWVGWSATGGTLVIEEVGRRLRGSLSNLQFAKGMSEINGEPVCPSTLAGLSFDVPIVSNFKAAEPQSEADAALVERLKQWLRTDLVRVGASR